MRWRNTSKPCLRKGDSLPVIRLGGAGDGQLAVQEILGGFSVYRQLFSLAAEGQPVQALGVGGEGGGQGLERPRLRA